MFKSPIPLYLLLLALTFASASYSFDYDNYLRFHWKGAVKSNSIQLKVFPYLDRLSGLNTFVVTYTKSSGTPVSPVATLIPFVQDPYPVQEVTLSGLSPNTQYFYTFIFTTDAVVDAVSFTAYYRASSPQEFPFRTFNLALTPYSFTFGAASCADTGSSSSVFQNLIDENFDFFMHMGDLHYEDISVNDANRFFEAYYTVFSSPSQKKFFQNVPVYYNWDDHDFGPNDANGNSLSKPAATMVFQKFATYSQLKNRLPVDDSSIVGAPSATLETPGMYLSYNSNSDRYGIFRSFIVGRCLFMILDLRSFQDVTPGDILGDEQRTWIENQLRFAGNNPNIKMVFMISSVPWIDQDSGAVWGDFGANQEWIGQLVRQHVYNNGKEAMMIAGDAHMVALDDGRNNNNGGFPVVQAASLDRSASCKGGPYSHGTNPERGQYARFEVTDSVDSKPCVKILLKRYGSNIIAYDTCIPQYYPPSEDNHCPSKFMIWLKTYPGAIYILAFGSLLVFALICVTIFMCRRRLRRKAALKRQQLGNEQKQPENVKS